MKFKKIIPLFLSLAISACSFCGCGTKAEGANSEKIKVVATVFPAYDFARQVGGDNIELSLLLKPGTESHTYEPSPQDILEIKSADLFIYTGGESDVWIDGVLSSLESDIKTVEMADCVELLCPDHEEEHDHDAHDHDAHEYDEHVWTSPKNAMLISEKIAEALIEIDAQNKDEYKSAQESFSDELKALDADFSEVVSTAKRKTLVFGDRFPLLYFAHEYGLEYFAAFPGCSSESEPSAKTMAELTSKVTELSIPVVFYIEFSTQKIAQAISEQTGCETALFHSCHNVSLEDIDKGATYISLMRNNLELLQKALN